MQDPYFFGYGSLVNRQTHRYPRAEVAVAQGWRRIWQPTRLRGLCFLSVHEVEGAEIEGLIAAVPGADWAALDERERAYERLPVRLMATPPSAQVAIYRTLAQHHATDEDQPVLLSYLDTVVQGFLAEFGEDGVARFFETTDNWPRQILDDRPEPIYPRATVLTPEETALVDQYLERLGCVKVVGG